MRSANFAVFVAFVTLSGCNGGVRRTVQIQSDPPGALVYMNEEEVGRTPLSKDFLWYGNYDVVVRKDGYETLKTQAALLPPVWQWIPLDLVSELFPLTDQHRLIFGLKPREPADPKVILARSEEMRGQLESSEHTKTHQPSTKPATTTQPAKK